MIFNFTKDQKGKFDWESELPDFISAREANPGLGVNLETKDAAELAIRHIVADLRLNRGDKSFAGAWGDFHELAKQPDTRASQLLAVSMAGVLTAVRHPAVRK